MYLNKLFVIDINMTLKDELMENTRQFKESADLVYGKNDFTSATILYFKGLFCFYDLKLLTAFGITPKNHTERFELLRTKFPGLYEELNLAFEIYRSTYTTKVSKRDCDDAKKLIEKHIKEM